MVKAPDGEKMSLRKVAWSTEEDQKLKAYIKRYGIWNWSRMPEAAGLARSGKSCRFRWMNYLRPDIKRGNFSEEDEETILKWHEVLGNRWSAIAAKLHGRTDNEIKNYWHTHLKKRGKNYSSSTNISQMVKTSEVEVNKNGSYGIQDLLLCNAPKVSNMGGTGGTPVTTKMSTDYLSSSSTDPAVEIVRNQPIEENFGSSNTSEAIQSLWEQPFSLQDICMLETDPGFMVSTTAVWLQEPIYPYIFYDAGNDFWID